MTTNSGTTETAQQAASTAADEGKHVASVASSEAQNVASTAAQEARHVVNDALEQVTGQLNDQAVTQRDNLVSTLRSLGDDLEQMVSQGGGSGLAADLAREVADRAKTLSSRLDGQEPGQLLDDVRGFARRRPGTFLLGALAAGVVAGRVLKAATEGTAAAAVAVDQQSAAASTGTSGYAGMTEPTGPPAGGYPTTGTPSGTPTTNPGYGTSTPGYPPTPAPSTTTPPTTGGTVGDLP